METETWRFNLADAKRQIAAEPTAKLHAQYVHHLNYIPGSPYVRPMALELERRGYWNETNPR